MILTALTALVSTFNIAVFVGVSLLNIVVGLVLQLPVLPWDPERRAALRANHLVWGRMLHPALPSMAMDRTLPDVGPGPYIVVCNHTSVLDIPACLGLNLPLRVVGRGGLSRVPVLGSWMRFSRQIVLPDDPSTAARFVGECRAALDAGISVLVFPEGTRSRDARLGTFGRGAFRLALDSGIPILPVVIHGHHLALPKGSFLPPTRYQRVRMRVLDPIPPTGVTTARALSNRTHAAMKAALAEIVVEPDAPAPWLALPQEAG